MVSGVLACCWVAVSVTVTVKVAGPAAVGMPVIRPVALRLSPGGSAPLPVQVSAPVPPAAASWLAG